MKMKQAGLIAEAACTWSPTTCWSSSPASSMQLYPNARLLVAAREDLARDRRKLLTAKVASGEWDGIVVTHSSGFERIGMSRGLPGERFLREQIAEYDGLLRRARRQDLGACNQQPHQGHREAKGEPARSACKALLAEGQEG